MRGGRGARALGWRPGQSLPTTESPGPPRAPGWGTGGRQCRRETTPRQRVPLPTKKLAWLVDTSLNPRRAGTSPRGREQYLRPHTHPGLCLGPSMNEVTVNRPGRGPPAITPSFVEGREGGGGAPRPERPREGAPQLVCISRRWTCAISPFPPQTLLEPEAPPAPGSSLSRKECAAAAIFGHTQALQSELDGQPCRTPAPRPQARLIRWNSSQDMGPGSPPSVLTPPPVITTL